MRASTRPVRAAVLTIITLLAYGTMPAQAHATTIAWTVCPEDAQVQCGTMRVPADWAAPSGPAITLTVARRAATDPARRLGVLLVNPGGPGGSAVDFTFNAATFFGDELRKRFDIVGVDPRGVGRSTPVLCSQDLVDAKPSPLIESEDQFAAMIDYNRRLAADCAARTGPVFDHVDTAGVVRDFEAVRVALGEKKINIYGASYGTLIGAGYAQRYPERLRALVLDSVVDHSADLDRFLTEETDAAQDAFGEFVKWCGRDTRCVLRGQNIPRLWTTALARARAGQLTDPYDAPRKVRVPDLVSVAFAAFYQPGWYNFALYLRDALAGAPVAGRRAPPPPVDLVDHSFAAVVCDDWHLPVTGFPDLRQRLQALAARAPQMRYSPLALRATTSCLGRLAPPDNPQRVLAPPSTLGPVLLVNARHDPASAYPWARRVAAQLGPRAGLLTYEGWGHVIYQTSPCVAAAVDKYLLTPAPIPPGGTCPAVEPQPFGIG